MNIYLAIRERKGDESSAEGAGKMNEPHVVLLYFIYT